MELIHQRRRSGSNIALFLTFFTMMMMRQNYQCHGFSSLPLPKNSLFKTTSRISGYTSNISTKRNTSCFLYSPRSNNNPKIIWSDSCKTFSRSSYSSKNKEYRSLSSLYLSPTSKDGLLSISPSCQGDRYQSTMHNRKTTLYSTSPRNTELRNKRR